MEAGARPDFVEHSREGFGLSEDQSLARGNRRRKRQGRLDTGRKREIEDACI